MKRIGRLKVANWIVSKLLCFSCIFSKMCNTKLRCLFCFCRWDKYYVLQLDVMGGENKVNKAQSMCFFCHLFFCGVGDGIHDSLKNPSLICFYPSLAFGIIAAAQQVCNGVCCSWRSAKVAGDSSSFHGSNRGLHVLVLFVLQSRCHGEGKRHAFTVTAAVSVVSQCFYLCSNSEQTASNLKSKFI